MKCSCKVLNAQNGNTLAEYGLIGSLVFLLSVAAVFAFSGAFNERLGGLKSDLIARIDVASANAAQVAAAKALHDAAAEAARVGAGLSGYGGDGRQAMTTGANGSVLGSSKGGQGQLENAIANLSESEKNLVRDVSNTAHEIARMQEALEMLSQYSDGDTSKFQNTQMMVNGRVMSAHDLAVALGDNGLAAKLEEKKNTVLASGIQGDVKDTVASITNEVKLDATKTSDKTNEVLYANTDPSQVKDVSDSVKTDGNASTICGTSGGVDSGKNCGG